MPDPTARGRFVWYELMTPDPVAAAAFYTAVTNWKTQAWDSPMETPYTMWMVGETSVGGMVELPKSLIDQGVPPHWMAHVCVDDADATTKQAVSLGAKVLNGPMDIPTVGRVAVIADPQGAVFGVYTPIGAAPGHEGPAKVGEFSWHELIATDHKAAFDFYSALFGWERMSAMDMGAMGIYQIYGRQGTQMGGMFNKPADMPMPPHWVLYIKVDDADLAAQKVTQHGGKVLNGPMDVPDGGRIVQCLDPQGGTFAVHSVTKGG